MHVVICTPTLQRPHDAYLESLKASAPVLEAAGIKHETLFEVGSAYISHARASMLRKAMSTAADAVVFIDHDVSWPPEDLVKLILTHGSVVAGTYRFKKPEVEYMSVWLCKEDGTPQRRESDGAIKADRVPAGFLRITRQVVRRFMRHYPDLVYGDPECPSVDLFNHGAHKGVWWGEDYAFSRRYRGTGRDIWLVPDLNITHHSATEAYPGNLQRWLDENGGVSKQNQDESAV